VFLYAFASVDKTAMDRNLIQKIRKELLFGKKQRLSFLPVLRRKISHFD
jgi:hypothetical protein